jgi:signal transduction histidine kinase
VQPPFWKTWWFYSMLLLLAVAILYWIDRERVRRLLTLQQVRTQIAGNLHHDINTTLNNINLLSEIAKIKADKDITKSKEYIDQINTISRRMIDAMDDMLWSIDPKNDSMQKTIERMQEFAEGLRNSNGCTIQLVVDEKLKTLKLDMKSRHEIFFIFKEALNSIIEHSNCTNAIINIDLVKSNLMIKIHDNGTGVAIKSLQNSKAIKEMQKRADTLNALLDIQSDKKGIAVILSVPVK